MTIIVSYLPWIIINWWKSNTFVNFSIQLIFTKLLFQFFTSHAIFNRRAYAKRVDRIISCKFSSFSICDVTSRGTLPTPHALKPNNCNNCFEVNLSKVGFGNDGHYFAIITNLSHPCWALAWAWLTSFWSFRFCTAMAFPKMQAFILTLFWCRGPPLEVEGLPSLAFAATKPCTSFKCLVNNHLAQYATM